MGLEVQYGPSGWGPGLSSPTSFVKQVLLDLAAPSWGSPTMPLVQVLRSSVSHNFTNLDTSKARHY